MTAKFECQNKKKIRKNNALVVDLAYEILKAY
jgi:hypothetical protein